MAFPLGRAARGACAPGDNARTVPVEAGPSVAQRATRPASSPWSAAWSSACARTRRASQCSPTRVPPLSQSSTTMEGALGSSASMPSGEQVSEISAQSSGPPVPPAPGRRWRSCHWSCSSRRRPLRPPSWSGSMGTDRRPARCAHRRPAGSRQQRAGARERGGRAVRAGEPPARECGSTNEGGSRHPLYSGRRGRPTQQSRLGGQLAHHARAPTRRARSCRVAQGPALFFHSSSRVRSASGGFSGGAEPAWSAVLTP